MMLLLALAAAVPQAGQVPGVLVVRNGDRTTGVPVVATRLGPMIRLEEALMPLGAVLMRDTPEKYRFIASGSEMELTIGVAFARSRGVAQPLAAPPTIFEGKLYVPLSLLTDVLPRVVSSYIFDAGTGELRRFAGMATPMPPPVAVATQRDAGGGAAASRAPPGAERRARRIVVVDAGHGGPDRGMTGPMLGRRESARHKIYEADITLSVAKRLRDALRGRGVDVVMTRTTDTLIALADRGRIANRAQGDVFVSIHVNAANPRWRDPSAARGFETYFLAEAKTEDEQRVAELENEAVKYEAEADAQAGDPLSFILNDMKQNEYLRESGELAQTIQAGLGRMHPGIDRGVKQAGFRVLVTAFMPSVLVEIGFGTNVGEAAYLSSEDGQRRLADAIADATVRYLSNYERRGSAGAPSPTR